MPVTPPTRASLIIGVARIVRGSYSTQGEVPFKLVIKPKHAEVKMSGQTIGKRWLGAICELSFVPDGRLTSAALSLFWNQFANMLPGASLFAGADIPTVLHCTDGETITIAASQVTKIPSLMLHPERGAIGSATISGLVGSGLAYTAASSFLDVGTGATFTDSGFTSAAILRQQYTAAFAGVTGFTSFQAAEGWQIDFNLSATEKPIQGPTRDFRFQGLEVMAKGTQLPEPTTSQLYDAMKVKSASSGAVPGREEAAIAAALTITGDVSGTAHVTIPLASIIEADNNFSSIDLRVGDVGFYGSRPSAIGAQSSLYTIA